MDIAYIGFGGMGCGMVRNLLKAGHAVTAWNRSERALPAELAQTQVVGTIAEAMVCRIGPFARLLRCWSQGPIRPPSTEAWAS